MRWGSKEEGGKTHSKHRHHPSQGRRGSLHSGYVASPGTGARPLDGSYQAPGLHRAPGLDCMLSVQQQAATLGSPPFQTHRPHCVTRAHTPLLQASLTSPLCPSGPDTPATPCNTLLVNGLTCARFLSPPEWGVGEHLGGKGLHFFSWTIHSFRQSLRPLHAHLTYNIWSPSISSSSPCLLPPTLPLPHDHTHICTPCHLP